MADQSPEKPEAVAPPAESPNGPAADAKPDELAKTETEAATVESEAPKEGSKTEEEPKAPESATDAAQPTTETKEEPQEESKPAPAGDVEMKDASDAAAPAQNETAMAKNNARRKSGAGDSKGKTLNKKASKARLTHVDAKPGDHFLVKLKGFPAWPGIICDEAMLPVALVNSRPVTAAREDGTYREAYADGGKRMGDRTFPVMYLHTNEFGWVANTAFTDLTAEKARDSINDKMRKDLRAAFELAAEQHPVDFYKDLLQKFQDEMLAREQEAARLAKEAASTPKKSKKSKAKSGGDDEDTEMVDGAESTKSKSKKRRADEDASTPQRSESVKKPKIKLNTSSTPKTANGSAAKPKDDSAAKASKPKAKKSKEGGEKKVSKENMTPEQKHARKEQEVLYLRHKLQRGLLTGPPDDAEMKNMSNYVGLLENFTDLEVSIIRATKINKVLKAILKLEKVPKDEEFNFKTRSRALLEKWNKRMADDAAQATPAAPANGVNGSADTQTEKKTEPNGVNKPAETKSPAAKSDEGKNSPSEVKEKEPAAATEKPAGDEQKSEKPVENAVAPAEQVEASA